MVIEGQSASPDLDPIAANRFRALTRLPFVLFAVSLCLGIACMLGSLAFIGDHRAFLVTVSVGAGLVALSFAVIGVAGLVWRFTPAWLETAASERLRRLRIGPHAYALSLAWCGVVLAVGMALWAMEILRADPNVPIPASIPHVDQIAATVAVVAVAPVIWVLIQGWRRRRALHVR